MESTAAQPPVDPEAITPEIATSPRRATWAQRSAWGGIAAALAGIALAILSLAVPRARPISRGSDATASLSHPAQLPESERRGDAGTQRRDGSAAPSLPRSLAPSFALPAAALAADRLRDPGGADVALLHDGTVRVKGRKLPPDLASRLFQLYVRERVPAPPPSRSAPAPTPAIRLLSPSPGDASLETTTPLFRWTAAAGTRQYRVVLEHLEEATASWAPVAGLSGRSVRGSEWCLPPETPLVPGERYRWHVEAEGGPAAPPSLPAEFRVLDERESRALQHARDRFANHPFLLGPHYEWLGLYEQAAWEYLKLTRANPASPAARRALENIEFRSQQHQAEAASRT